MRITDLNSKRICILGFGKEGQAMLTALRAHGIDARITIADMNETLAAQWTMADCQWQLGPTFLDHLDAFDVIIKSPGIPPSEKLAEHRARITSSTQIFLDTVREAGAMVIGITGSKGKSTTSALLTAILKADGRDVHLVGNIGTPAIGFLKSAEMNTIFVQEMSSYQLMDLTMSPHIAVVTSFFPEHIDYHGSLEAYKKAKKNITRFQSSDDFVFCAAHSAGAMEIAEEGSGRIVPYSAEDAPVTIEETHLLGAHNLSNIAAAYLVAQKMGVPRETVIAAIKAFQGLPHRLQMLPRMHDIDWVDDAISTTPESTIAALQALGKRVNTVILGGLDRGYDFRELAEEIVHHTQIGHIILFPETGARIRKALEDALTHSPHKLVFFDASSMESAVRFARARTQPQSICLLSTASPSYNMFKNFEEKGDAFQRCIAEQ
jgi:UDP-N-acetylmuramoyl-L-alanine---L-glutamate ligase